MSLGKYYFVYLNLKKNVEEKILLTSTNEDQAIPEGRAMWQRIAQTVNKKYRSKPRVIYEKVFDIYI